ncbi:MAG: hypothetical protein A3J38_00095 [Gammaproteobacteria bacterium RIFCSPHIGHO2_12_FULL_45_9]|nr:MAG: hypothetical protein A3J38_00095 [Gammaproteobacteria bacterium RIFCSPHIGHO2_12_FULL_45_9]
MIGWEELRRLANQLWETPIAELCHAPHRVHTQLWEAAGITLDATNTHVTDTAWPVLLAYAKQVGIDAGFSALFHEQKVNQSEDCAATHVLWRRTEKSPTRSARFLQLRELVDTIRGDVWRGVTNKPFRHIVHIGIGGSDAGPRLLWEALRSPVEPPRYTVHFLANLDEQAFAESVMGLDPESTLCIIASKSFATLETDRNMMRARHWLESSVGPTAWATQAIAVTAHPERAVSQGFSATHILPFEMDLGGRFSIWSSVSLAAILNLGWSVYTDFLAGAEAIDQYVMAHPLENPATRAALIDFLYANFMPTADHVIVPYAHAWRTLPEYLQQLFLESLGKGITQNGEPVTTLTTPACWGGVGTLSQHSFFQWLHHSPRSVFIELLVSRHDYHQRKNVDMVAQMLGQSAALREGRPLPHNTLPGRPGAWAHGNRPHVLIWTDSLSAKNLGALLAFYEHRVYAESMLWHINAFDQWGVECGKQLAQKTRRVLSGDDDAAISLFQRELIQRLQLQPMEETV